MGLETPLLSNLQSQQEREVEDYSRHSRRRRSSSRDRYRRDDRREDSRRDDRRDDRRDRDSGRDRDSHRRDFDRRERPREERREYSRREERVDPNTTPLHLRKSRTGCWDRAPAGCDGMTAGQVKNSAPGQPAKNTYLAATGGAMNTYGYNPAVFGTTSALGPSALSVNRRLYVGNIPANIKETGLVDFLNATIKKNKLVSGSGEVVSSAEINREKGYALVTVGLVFPCIFQESEAALAMNGMEIEGRAMEIRKPKEDDEIVRTTISTSVQDSPNKVFVGSIPSYLTDEQVMELLKAFGELKSFTLVKDSVTGLSKGFAFCEYNDVETGDLAVQGLNGMEIGDKKLIVQRSLTTGVKNPEYAGLARSDIPLLPMDILSFMAKTPCPPTRVLMLLNMISELDIADDEDFEEIKKDILEECQKSGTVELIVIPRPKPDERVPGLGKIFVKFPTADECVVAQKSLAGRQYNDRSIITGFLDEERFEKGDL